MRIRFALELIAGLTLAGAAWAVDVKTATLADSFAWRHPAEWFGGFSAIHVSDKGRSFIALSDRATFVTGRIERDNGAIADVRILGHWPVLSSTGRIMLGYAGDSEGLAVAPDGSLFVSFEGVHRVAHYAAPGTHARVLPRPSAFDGLDRNGSFEALAMDRRGWVYTLTEKSRTLEGDIPVYRWDGQSWSTPFVLPARGGFLPVSADFGPDGRLYVLERSVSLTGFRTRLRRWDTTGDEPSAEETLLETATGTHDNLEGLSIWRDAQGRMRATMVSDDNFLALQRTELVEYLLPD